MEFFDEETGNIKPEYEDLHNFVRQYFEGQDSADTVLGFWEYIPYKEKVQMLVYWAECHLEDICLEGIKTDKDIKYVVQQVGEAKKTLVMLKALKP